MLDELMLSFPNGINDVYAKDFEILPIEKKLAL